MKKFNFLLSFYLIPLESIFSGILNSSEKENKIYENEETELNYEQINNFDNNLKNKKQKKIRKENFHNNQFDIGDSLRTLYRNYSSIDLGIHDLLYINRKEIINQLQVITIWEYLVNVKTGRNIDMFGNDKIYFDEEEESNVVHNLDSRNNKSNINKLSLFSYLRIVTEKMIKALGFNFDNFLLNFGNFINHDKEAINKHDLHDENINKKNNNNKNKNEKSDQSSYKNYFEKENWFYLNFSRFLKKLDYLKLKNTNIASIAILFICAFFNKITKYLIKIPKVNIIILAALMFVNLKCCFYFYSKKLFFASFINFWFFVNLIHHFYLSIVVLSENKENDYSIFFPNNFLSEKVFYVKCLVVTVIVILNKYYHLSYFKKFYFYILEIFYQDMLKTLIINFYKNRSPAYLQPFENFVGFVFGIFNLFITNGFYLLNILYSYEYNSYIFINNIYSFYLLTNLDDLIFCYKNKIGEMYLENRDMENEKKNRMLYLSLKEKALENRKFEYKYLLKNNSNSTIDEDFILVSFTIFILLISFLYDSIFGIFLSLYIFKIYKRNSICFYSTKTKRILSSFFMGIFLFFSFNSKFFNFFSINQIVAINDERFVLAIKLLLKLILIIFTLFCFFLTRDFFSLFYIYSYTSYKYILEEGINEDNRSDEDSRKNIKLNSFDFSPNSENMSKSSLFDSENSNCLTNKLNFAHPSFLNSENSNFDNEGFTLFANPIFGFGANIMKNINIDIGINTGLLGSYKRTNKSINLNNNTSHLSSSNTKNNTHNNLNSNKNSNLNSNTFITNQNYTLNNIQNSNYRKYLDEKNEDNISQYTKKIKEIYNLNNSLDEIFCFSIEKSTTYINSILETLNFKSNNSNKIDSVYIEFLITKSTKHFYLFGLIFDYFLLYFNFWMVNFALKEENQNYYLFSGLLQAFKIGISLKLFLLIFEYSKSRTQILTVVILNCFLFNRLITYNGSNIFDYYLLTLLINLNKVIYLYFVDNSYSVNLLIFIFSFIEFRRNKEIYLLCFLVCCLCFKTVFAYFQRRLVNKKLGFIFFSLTFILLFIVVHQESLDFLYEYMQESIIWYSKIDVIGIFEYLCFNSITVPSKYFAKQNKDFIFIQKSNFFEEYYIKEFLKYFIRLKIIKL